MTLEEKINEELNQKEEEVKAEERMNFLVKVVNSIKKGTLSKEVAIEELGFTEEEINKYM